VITYSIDTSVGPIGRGIPSEHVAVKIAVDAMLYRDDYEESEGETWRQNLVVEAATDNYFGDAMSILRNGREIARVNEERRCDHCGMCPQTWLPAA